MVGPAMHAADAPSARTVGAPVLSRAAASDPPRASNPRKGLACQDLQPERSRPPSHQAPTVREKLGHVPALDGLRGVAIAAVLGFHFLHLPGGFFGVDLFFVLSGFLITTLLLEEHAVSGYISFRRFYGRRARRLLPALSVVLVLSLLLAAAMFAVGNAASSRFELEGIAACAFYVANLFPMLGHGLPQQLTPMWSLAQEEQFYFVWPALFAFCFRGRPKRLAVALLLIGVAIVVWRAVLVAHGTSPARVYYGPDAHFDGLVFGAALAAARFAGLPTELSRFGPAKAAGPVALIGFVASVSLFHDGTSMAYALGFPAVEAAAVALIVAAVDGAAPLLSWGPVVWLGSISYGVYVWMGMVMLFFGLGPVQMLIAVCAGWASTQWIERPFRRQRARFEPTAVASTAAAVATGAP
jgi:peptidoglycan/LPS O-acetylase OafA/YrhL